MPGTPNPLSEMGKQKRVVVSADERPNPSFAQSALPGFKKAVQGRRAIRKFDGQPIPDAVMRDCFRDAILAPSSSNLQLSYIESLLVCNYSSIDSLSSHSNINDSLGC